MAVLVVPLVGGLALGPFVAVGGAGSPGHDGTGATAPDSVPGSQFDANHTLLQITLHPDGSATWRVEYRIRLESENDSQAFRELREDIESNPAEYTEPFAEDMRATAASAENATGRSMAIENVTVEAYRKPLGDYGVVAYQFRWTGFANVTDNGSTLRAGDALRGLFLDDETSLMIVWPEEYTLRAVDPEPDRTRARAVVWTGPTNFVEGQPRVVVSTDDDGPPGGNGGDDGRTNPPSGPFSPAVVGGILLVAGALVVGIFVFARRAGPGGDGPAGTAGAGGPGEAGAGGPGEAGAGGPGEAGAGGPGAAGGGGAGTPPRELMSNEEQVLALLEERGGRVKQQEVATELDWTDAKTSQVVTGMREDDRVDVFRLGRENVVSMPEDEGES